MNQLTKESADEILRRASERFIVVYGDVMLDEFVWGDVTRISPEGPVPVVDVRRESVHLGGAANVLANMVALGARASVVGVVGNDAAAERVRAELKGTVAGGETLVVDESRPTTLKTRIIAHSQLVVRADREERAPVSPETEERIISVLTEAVKKADAFVVSDYDKGAVTPRVLSEVLPNVYARGTPVLIDPKIRNFDSYHPATLVTPNHHEALRLTNTEDHGDEGLKRAAHLIRERVNCESVLITRGERGMMLLESYHEPVYVETAAREVYDVTGAGDTVIATLAVALSGGATMLEAATLANHAAGIVVGKVGTATASAEELVNSIQRKT
jgi:D-beta-D-heptose 7-phosphate kinase/D-beta-D-heptose 1-phosphate adenosyltransferase